MRVHKTRHDTPEISVPLPTLTPADQPGKEDRQVNGATSELRSQDPAEQDHATVHGCEQPWPSMSAKESGESDSKGRVLNNFRVDLRAPNAERGEADWRNSNAFDRNTYYGPTDFALVPDGSGCLEATRFNSNKEFASLDAFSGGTSPIGFGGSQPHSAHRLTSSRLHLATQIRHN
ncbi:MAG: hypothetical protein CMM01_18565 [Rhodopirellula sp.]|nr:hypothetical protein [Rhodopirellula sp.]